MKRSGFRLSLEVTLIIGALALVPSGLKAEGFAGLGLGATFTKDADFKPPKGSGVGTEYAFTPGVSLAARGGYWFEGADWLGLAGSLSYFESTMRPRQHPKGTDRDGLLAVPLSALVMIRFQLIPGPEFPHGRLQPYVGVGPSLFISRIEPAGGAEETSTAFNMGLDLRAGVVYQILPRLGIFTEYQYTYARPQFSYTLNSAVGRTDVDVDLSSHHFLAGVTVPF